MKAMETLQDLIEEAKLRTVYWALCIFAVSYFLTHTSKSMWMNIPISILFVSALRILFNEVEFHWKVRNFRQQSYLAHLEKKQLSVNDSRLSTMPPPQKWKRKIDSPIVKAAMEEFVNKLLQDFVRDLWYTDITPDKEAPELMRTVVMDVLGEISGRLKEINLVDLLTRDVVDLVGNHLDLFRRNQTAIGVDVMGTLSSEERDERLKHHLIASKELHPALISPECEYKVLQRLIGGLLAVVLRPREAQCPLVRCIARELVTCLVMQPVMNFASPGYVNELIEYVFLANKDDVSTVAGDNRSPNVTGHTTDRTVALNVMQNEFTSRKNVSSHSPGTALTGTRSDNKKGTSLDAPEIMNSDLFGEESMQPQPADWARVLDAATQRRKEVLMPENLENMWTIGRNYKKKVQKIAAGGLQAPVAKGLVTNTSEARKNSGKEMPTSRAVISSATDDKSLVQLPARLQTETRIGDGKNNALHLSHDLNKEQSVVGVHLDELEDTTSFTAIGNKGGLKRSNSTSALKIQPNVKKAFTGEDGGSIISEFYSPDFGRHNNVPTVKSASDKVFCSEGVHNPKLRCRVIGAYFEKLGSTSFAVYSIAVTDADKNTWFVKRRYRNFERLHRHLKDIPNYTLHLPPKRIFSSSTEDAFVHQRCIRLDKYLQDLLSIANVAEQHEVWDFLSVSSKNYSFGKSSSVMRSLAVNVDDAVDDILRQFKGKRKVVASSSPLHESSPAISTTNLSWNADEINKHLNSEESAKSFSDNEEGDKDGIYGHEEVGPTVQANGWHSDNELDSKGFPPRVVKRGEKFVISDSEKIHGSEAKSLSVSLAGYPAAGFPVTSDHLQDPTEVPPEWTPPKLSIPVLNLVDKMFQLKRRGWLRRQVFWISKQILQLMMEDAIDDWLLRQIQLLRRDDIIAQGIRWVQDVLWPEGTFFMRLNTQTEIEMEDCQPKERSSQSTSHCSKVSKQGSFEQQLEAARRASDVKKMIFNGAPTALVSLIGHKQYRRCAKDIYYFLQSSICLKQLGYGILELILLSVFPELRDVVLDVHEKMRTQSL
ncbi:Sorting nexin-16 like [Actinidia chinensis var. chinensis]|uniref:Sorting nexin-16 like n=1 Tax=Actinidia chinensis var. chinensis TaxID=1590841 RepID=A0A2R6RH82_ACTCC|nr:Sorting nexin-16 like [Actinidia chinensis var. chinensis]